MTNPTFVSQLSYNYTYDIITRDTIAYLAANSDGLQIIDIADPFHPSKIGNYISTINTFGVDVNNDYAFIVDDSGMKVIDISNLNSPFLSNSIAISNKAHKVKVVSNYAFIAADYSGLRIIDISNLPIELNEVGYYDSPGASYDMSINGNIVYLSDGGHSLRIVDISTISNPQEITFYDTPSYCYGVDVKDNFAYVAGTGKGLRIIDISDINNPIEVGSYYSNTDIHASNTDTYFLNLKVVGDYVYAANSYRGLMILDVTNKNSPNVIGEKDTEGQSLDIDVDGDYAYVADNTGGLYIFNISNPSSPTQSGRYNLINSAEGVAVQGNYAYVADGLNGFYVINVSDKTTPTLAGSCSTTNEALKVAVKGNYAYVADASSGLQVINIGNPSNPTIIGNYNTGDRAQDVTISGQFAYVADGTDGVRIIDISNPYSPIEKGYFLTPSEGIGIMSIGDTIYEADKDGGLMIIRNEVPVAVELYSFIAKYTGNSISLSWETATEINNYGFKIEKKNENTNWTDIDFIRGYGNSNSTKKYSFIDKDIFGTSKWYYRLKQIDNSGSYKYSNVVDVKVSPNSYSLSQNYPNPFNPSTNIKYTLSVKSFVKLTIYDILGNQVKILINENQQPGYYDIKFNGQDLPSGVYIYRIEFKANELSNMGYIYTKKMVLLK